MHFTKETNFSIINSHAIYHIHTHKTNQHLRLREQSHFWSNHGNSNNIKSKPSEEQENSPEGPPAAAKLPSENSSCLSLRFPVRICQFFFGLFFSFFCNKKKSRKRNQFFQIFFSNFFNKNENCLKLVRRARVSRSHAVIASRFLAFRTSQIITFAIRRIFHGSFSGKHFFLFKKRRIKMDKEKQQA